MKSHATNTKILEKKQGVSQSKATTGNKTSATKKRVGKTLEELFVGELKNIYTVEKQMMKVLPELAEAAYNQDLRDAFEIHLQQTKRHVERLEKIVDRLRLDIDEVESSEIMESLISECRKIITAFEEGPVRDSALIIGSQKIEHYEIASYGSLCELADVLGYTKIAELLDRTLEEEETADKNLTSIAQDVNDDAYEMEHEKVY